MWYIHGMWILALIFVIPCVVLWIAFEIVRFLAWMLIEFGVLVWLWVSEH